MSDDTNPADLALRPGESDTRTEEQHGEQQSANGAHAATPEIDVSVLRLNRRAPSPFPLAVLGPEWMSWVKFAAEAACCPIDYVAAPLLASASALIGHSRWAEAWPGWAEPPHLWLAAVGDSGDGKSPGAVALFRHVIPELERRMVLDYPDRWREWRVRADIAEERQRNWKHEVARALRRRWAIPMKALEEDPDPEPQEPRLRLTDVTVTKVALILATAAPKGLLMVRDELAGFLVGMNQYDSAARQFWLEAWSGNAYRVDRMTRPKPIIVPRLAVSWFGGVQPPRLAQLLAEPDDGLLARFLWCWPDPIAFARSRTRPDIDFATRSLDRLRVLDLQHHDDGSMEPHLVPLQAAAQARIAAFANEMTRRRDLCAGLLRSAYGKTRGVALRLALVLEMLWWCGKDAMEAPPSEISDAALEMAVLWVGDYAMRMAERTYGDAACSQAERNLSTLARWVVQEHPPELHVRTLQRRVRLPGLTTAETIHAACRGLVDYGWLLPGNRPHGNDHNRAAYPVNRDLWNALGLTPLLSHNTGQW
jgi:hypothetical protein